MISRDSDQTPGDFRAGSHSYGLWDFPRSPHVARAVILLNLNVDLFCEGCFCRCAVSECAAEMLIYIGRTGIPPSPVLLRYRTFVGPICLIAVSTFLARRVTRSFCIAFDRSMSYMCACAIHAMRIFVLVRFAAVRLKILHQHLPKLTATCPPLPIPFLPFPGTAKPSSHGHDTSRPTVD